MRTFIFITTEGFTFSPNNTDSEPDIENCQVLGLEIANNAAEAFKNLKRNNSILNDLGFKKVCCYELTNENSPQYFSLL